MKNKKKIIIVNAIMITLGMIVGFSCGIASARVVDVLEETNGFMGKYTVFTTFIIMGVCLVGAYIQVILHEAGHLIGGLVSGYKFLSFRIGSFILLNNDGKLKIGRLSIAGTGGQCLMIPPDLVNGKCPYMLYNLGGALFNIFTAIIYLIVAFIFKDNIILSTLLFVEALVAVVIGLFNGIPFKTELINNDGSNALEMKKDNRALYAFWLQLKINAEVSKGIRLKDLPNEWFELPEDLSGSLLATVAVLKSNQLIDCKMFEEAKTLIDHLLETKTGMVGLNRSLIISDRIYLELVTTNNKELIDKLYNKEQMKFMKAMKKFPSIIRTNYAYTLLYTKEKEEAIKILNQFYEVSKKYPLPADITSERELMNIVDERMETTEA